MTVPHDCRRGDRTEAERLAEGRTLDVFEASALGDTDRVRRLVEADRSVTNAFGDDGFQPLGLAVFFGHPETARLLIDSGAEVNSPSRNDFKVMPLHSACAVKDPAKRYALAELLLERGADPNARQQDDFTPLMAADQVGDTRLRELLVQHGATA